MSNEEIRTQLLKLLDVAEKQNIYYNYEERREVLRLKEVLEKVNPDFEKYNQKYPEHGKEINKIKKKNK